MPEVYVAHTRDWDSGLGIWDSELWPDLGWPFIASALLKCTLLLLLPFSSSDPTLLFHTGLRPALLGLAKKPRVCVPTVLRMHTRKYVVRIHAVPKIVFISFLLKTSNSKFCPVLVWGNPFFTCLCPCAFRGSVAMLTILFIYLLSSGRSFYSSLCLSVGLH